LYNYWYPSFKLVETVKQENGRYKKVYEKAPRTPCQRLLDSSVVSKESKTELLRRKGLYNPVGLNRGLHEAVGRLLQLNREQGYAQDAPVQEAGQTGVD
jgi:hypothetical protein